MVDVNLYNACRAFPRSGVNFGPWRINRDFLQYRGRSVGYYTEEDDSIYVSPHEECLAPLLPYRDEEGHVPRSSLDLIRGLWT